MAGAGSDEFRSSTPWRTFRWSFGQKYFSGTYWSSAMGGNVIYEYRLELTRLIYADFDSATTVNIAVDGGPHRSVTTVKTGR